MLYSSYRIRDPPPFIIYREGPSLQIGADFLVRISSVDGWAILDTFWTTYPELVKGLDPLKFKISEKDFSDKI